MKGTSPTEIPSRAKLQWSVTKCSEK